MRDIKFRAWDIKNEVMTAASMSNIYRNKHSLWGDIYLLQKETFDDTVRVELMQYTGLKDKNGVEIYEGDIVPITTWEETSYEWIEDVSKNHVIKFISGGFALHKDGVKPYGNWYWLHDRAHVIEVIGNIYEHPHLLADSK